jgi:hypothetical protein
MHATSCLHHSIMCSTVDEYVAALIKFNNDPNKRSLLVYGSSGFSSIAIESIVSIQSRTNSLAICIIGSNAPLLVERKEEMKGDFDNVKRTITDIWARKRELLFNRKYGKDSYSDDDDEEETSDPLVAEPVPEWNLSTPPVGWGSPERAKAPATAEPTPECDSPYPLANQPLLHRRKNAKLSNE